MKLHFLKGIGPYRRGAVKNVPDKLARFYIKQGIAEQVVYQNKVEELYNTKVVEPVKRVLTPKPAEPVAEPVIETAEVAEPVIETAEVAEPVIETAEVAEPVEGDVLPELTVTDEFEGLGVEELRAIAELRGIKVHHKAGAEKIKEALKGEA